MLSGLGDLGTLIPYLLGYILVVGMPAQQVFGLMGLLLMGIGTLYRLPMPVQPMKAIGALAIVAAASGQPNLPALLVMSSLLTAAIWLAFALTPAVSSPIKRLPPWVPHLIAITLGVSMIYSAATALLAGHLPGQIAHDTTLTGQPRTESLSLEAIWSMVLAQGVSSWMLAMTWVAIQLPLTVGNACLATHAQVQHYFPDQSVSVSRIAFSTGLMNAVAGLLGGFPVCHGVGGLAGYQMIGARTALPVMTMGTLLLLLGFGCPELATQWLMQIPSWLVSFLLAWAGVYLAYGALKRLRST